MGFINLVAYFVLSLVSLFHLPTVLGATGLNSATSSTAITTAKNDSSVANSHSCQSVFVKQAQKFTYPKSINSLEMTQPHTIKDLPKYIKDKIGVLPFDMASNKEVGYTLFLGPGDSPLLKNELSDVMYKKSIENSFGAFNVTQLIRKNGKTEFLFTNVNGQSRFLQVLSFLKLAGVDESQIQIRGEQKNYKSLYLKTFNEIGHVPDLVVFGFANTAIEGFRDLARSDWHKVKDQNEQYSSNKWIKPSFNQHELQNMGVQVLSLNGNRKIWFIDNEYGDRAADLTQALIDFGVKNILALGTAGAINSKLKIGELVSPKNLIYENGKFVENVSQDFFKAKTVNHGHVDSPALETQKWLQRQLQNNIEVIDVELQKIVEVILKNKSSENLITFDSYLIVSDVIHGEHTVDYTFWSEKNRQQQIKPIQKILLEFLKFLGVENVDKVEDYKIQKFILGRNSNVIKLQSMFESTQSTAKVMGFHFYNVFERNAS